MSQYQQDKVPGMEFQDQRVFELRILFISIRPPERMYQVNYHKILYRNLFLKFDVIFSIN